MNLYLLTIKSGVSYHVVANNCLEAEKKVTGMLIKNDWYCLSDRKVEKIELLSEEGRIDPILIL